MPKRSSGIFWLVSGLFFGLVTLVILCGGGYAVWHTHNNIQLTEQRLESDERELQQLRVREGAPDAQRFQELINRVEGSGPELQKAEQYRNYAIAVVVTFIVPALMTFSCLLMFATKWLKNRAVRLKAEAAEEEE